MKVYLTKTRQLSAMLSLEHWHLQSELPSTNGGLEDWSQQTFSFFVASRACRRASTTYDIHCRARFEFAQEKKRTHRFPKSPAKKRITVVRARQRFQDSLLLLTTMQHWDIELPSMLPILAYRVTKDPARNVQKSQKKTRSDQQLHAPARFAARIFSSCQRSDKSVDDPSLVRNLRRFVLTEPSVSSPLDSLQRLHCSTSL